MSRRPGNASTNWPSGSPALGLTDTGLYDPYSEASLGKAYLKTMNIGRWRDLQPKFPPQIIGRILSAYYGGRAEVHIRRRIVVVAADFHGLPRTGLSAEVFKIDPRSMIANEHEEAVARRQSSRQRCICRVAAIKVCDHLARKRRHKAAVVRAGRIDEFDLGKRCLKPVPRRDEIVRVKLRAASAHSLRDHGVRPDDCDHSSPAGRER